MTRATFEKGAKLERWERNFQNPRNALKQIGALMVAESREAFREQKHGRDRWKPRSDVNVFGIIKDFAGGATAPPARRFERRPALSDTGRLKQSIAFKVFGRSVVEVGTNLPYAKVHQEGGAVKSEKITKGVQEALWKWLKKKDKTLKRRLGFLLNKKFRGKFLEGEVPKRPFVGITKQTRADVLEVVGLRILEVR